MSKKTVQRAVIFDLDGVLTDTAHYHFLAWKHIAEQVGVHFDEESNEQLKGIDRLNSLKFILDQSSQSFTEQEFHALADKKNTHYQSLIATMKPEDVFPGVRDLIASLRAANFALGVASVSKNAQYVLDKIALISEFDYVADAAKIQNTKPHPEIFLTVAEALSISPANCVGIEDAAAGVTAIKAASMPAIGVGSPEQLSHADEIVVKTGDITVEQILGLI